jgi:hypothetical protein
MAWTTKMLAERASVSTGFIRQELIAGKIKGEKIGRDWIISDEEAKRWLRERGIEVADEPEEEK